MEEYKGFKLNICPAYCVWSINQLGSGAVPVALQGTYTSKKHAMEAINGYSPKRGAKKNVETSSTADV